MRKAVTFTGGVLAAVMLTAVPAHTMQPPGEPAQDRFGCVGGEDSPVAGHPGAAGLLDAAPLVGALTDDPLPTAWNAVEHAGPIELGGC